MAQVDFGLDRLYKNLAAASDKRKVAAVKQKALLRLAPMLLKRAKQLTPVKTGYLRRGWHTETEGDMLWLENNVDYAPSVNYGHRQTPGRYVPAIGKRLKTGYVRGQFMLEKSIGQTEKQDLTRELEAATDEILGGIF